MSAPALIQIITLVHKAEDVMVLKTRKKVKRIQFWEFSAALCPFWPFFSFWWQFIMHKRPLFILDNCMPYKEHDYRCYPVCYICSNSILLHLPDIWYLFHHRWNLFPTRNKRQMCPLLSCHYPCHYHVQMCVWYGWGKHLTCSFWSNAVVSPRNAIKKLQNCFFSVPTVYFLPFFSWDKSTKCMSKLRRHQKHI